MYSKIVNPASGRFVSVNGKLGKEILKNYLSYSNKRWFRLHGGAVEMSEEDTPGAEEVAANAEETVVAEDAAKQEAEAAAAAEAAVKQEAEAAAAKQEAEEAVVKQEAEAATAVVEAPEQVVDEKTEPVQTEQKSWWSNFKFWGGGGAYTQEDFGQPFDYFKN